MNELYYISAELLETISPYFPTSRGISRLDDITIISGIIYVLKNDLQWKDAPAQYGSHKTLYHRFLRWSRRGIFNKIFEEFIKAGVFNKETTVDETLIRTHVTAAKLLKSGFFPAVSAINNAGKV